MTPASLALLFLLGLGLSAAPGALNVETVRRGLRHGFASALTLQLGALLGDAVWVGVAAAAVAFGADTTAAGPACMLLGGAALLWTAWQILRPERRPAASGPRLPSPRWGLAVGAALALSSPLTIVFWAAVQSMLTDQLGRTATTSELAMVAGAYALSVLVWAVGLSAVAAWGGRLVRPGATRVVSVGCAALLAAWGVQLLGRAATVLA
jgi:threonine/homoserine/homoserine lactone efflux protein